MRSTIRQLRRAPIRAAASMLAIALAIAAMGVFAVPGVAEDSLRRVAAEDHLTHLSIATTPFDGLPFDASDVGADVVEVRSVESIRVGEDEVFVVGRDAAASIDQWRVVDGRQPTESGEVLVSDDLADAVGLLVGDSFAIGASIVEIVGIGDTTWFADVPALVGDAATAEAITGTTGHNRIVAQLADPTEAALDAAVAAMRAELDAAEIGLVSFPQTLPGGAHPIEEDITQISFMIGSLGVVAGIVALVLLASTTSAIVTERSRDAAVMRAVGATGRTVRRELRRVAMLIGGFGTILGLPLGVLVANLVASMVLERFAGISPDLAVDPIVLVAGLAFGIIGARIVSGRAARRVTRHELAAALRDSDATPFGRRLVDRLATRIPTGGLLQRIALRAGLRRRGRAVAVTAQFAGAVGAAVLVASLGSSITDFNGAELESYTWDRVVVPDNPVHPWAIDDRGPEVEPAILVEGRVDDWEIEVVGLHPDTVMFDRSVAAGGWLEGTGDVGADAVPVVLAERFAVQNDHAIGDVVEVDVASGTVDAVVVGHHPIRSVAAFMPIDRLADVLGTAGGANRLWLGGSAEVPAFDGASTVIDRDQLFAEDAAARDAILGIFAAIGLIVVAIAALGTASTVAMGLHERRSEFATVQALGGPKRTIAELVGRELAPLAVIGWAVGVVGGAFGARAIMDFFAQANAIDLGFTLAWSAVPWSGAAVVVMVMVLAALAARQTSRRSAAAVLRAAA